MSIRTIIEWALLAVVVVVLVFLFKGCFVKEEGIKVSTTVKVDH